MDVEALANTLLREAAADGLPRPRETLEERTMNPEYQTLCFRMNFDDDGNERVTVSSPWYRDVIIHDSLLEENNPQMFHFIEHVPLRLKFTPTNGWAVYEREERDLWRQQSLWRCVEYWGPERE